MKKQDGLWLAFLIGLAGFIWYRDQTWLGEGADGLLILAAFGVFIWLGAPWSWRATGFSLHPPALIVAAIACVAGLQTNLTLLLAVGWTAALWSWLHERLEPECAARTRRLLVLPLLGFPWLTEDFPTLAWWFRLSAAWTAEQSFHWLGFAVQREGTQLFVQQMPFDVGPACSGIKGLQAIWVMGTVLCALQLGRSRAYLPSLAALPVVAWIANTLRVLALMVVALTLGPEYASGWYHSAGGWLVLFSTFALLWVGLEWWRRMPVRMASA